MVPLISGQAFSATVNGLLGEDSEMVVWWGTQVECAVAISRLRREGNLDDESEGQSRIALDVLATDWTEIEPTEDVRISASLLSRNHPLKAADASQLAAALRWCEGDTQDANFVCLDNRLRRAVQEEGFGVFPGLQEAE